MSIVVAIDGPAGAGKSTIARQLAVLLGFTYLDSGAMYRCVALRAVEAGVAPDQADDVGALAESSAIDFAPGSPQRVLLDGRDVTEAIRTPEISALASRVSVHPRVRRAMVARQRALGADGGVVMEGRDIGSVVFPDAALKVFLTASPEERARRRRLELETRGAAPEHLDGVLAEILERDLRDTSRADSPLVCADGAVTVLTDGKSPSELVDELGALARERGA